MKRCLVLVPSVLPISATSQNSSWGELLPLDAAAVDEQAFKQAFGNGPV